MVMSTAADWLDVEDDADPDTLKVPENPDHRRIVDALGIVEPASSGQTRSCIAT